MENNQWYTQHSEQDWYRPAEPEQTVSVKKPRKKLRNARPAFKSAMIVVFVLILVVASAVAFSEDAPADTSLSGKGDLPELPSGNGSDETNETDEPYGFDGFTDPDDGYDDDFRDYFSDFYVVDDTAEGSSIARAQGDASLELSLVSAAGHERLTLGEVYDKCIGSIVGISATQKGSDGYFWGTGVIMTGDGYIITNAHIIEGTDHATVYTADGAEYEALLIGEDTRSDIAVLKINAKGLQAAEFGVSGELGVGDEVVAIGNPLGMELTGTMTNGIISAISRDVLYDGHYMSLLQTNTAINEGNSGGPLINMYGQVIGITNMKMVADISSATIEGIGFAIPSATVKSVVDDLIANGEVTGRPGIGVTLGALPQEAMDHYGLPAGLYVTDVVKKSGADLAGIQIGDVVTHINGKAVTAISDVNLARDGYGVGDTITMTIFRGGETYTVEVILVDMNDLY